MTTRHEQYDIESYLMDELGFKADELYNSLSGWLSADEMYEWLVDFCCIREIEIESED